MKAIYRLEKVRYYCYDYTEGEDVEERIILGHFDALEQLDDAINICVLNGLEKNEICISTFFDNFSKNQKYVYILSHQYSLKRDGEYIYYEYVFRPFSNRKKCKMLKERLMKENRYKHTSDRNYDIQPPDGFYISKQRINLLEMEKKT